MTQTFTLRSRLYGVLQSVPQPFTTERGGRYIGGYWGPHRIFANVDESDVTLVEDPKALYARHNEFGGVVYTRTRAQLDAAVAHGPADGWVVEYEADRDEYWAAINGQGHYLTRVF